MEIVGAKFENNLSQPIAQDTWCKDGTFRGLGDAHILRGRSQGTRPCSSLHTSKKALKNSVSFYFTAYKIESTTGT